MLSTGLRCGWQMASAGFSSNWCLCYSWLSVWLDNAVSKESKKIKGTFYVELDTPTPRISILIRGLSINQSIYWLVTINGLDLWLLSSLNMSRFYFPCVPQFLLSLITISLYHSKEPSKFSTCTVFNVIYWDLLNKDNTSQLAGGCS